jgi:hypothetical protein
VQGEQRGENGGPEANVECTHFLRIPINVLSFDPSLGASSAAGASGGGVAAGVEDENAHIVGLREPSRHSAGSHRRGRSKKRCSDRWRCSREASLGVRDGSAQEFSCSSKLAVEGQTVAGLTLVGWAGGRSAGRAPTKQRIRRSGGPIRDKLRGLHNTPPKKAPFQVVKEKQTGGSPPVNSTFTTQLTGFFYFSLGHLERRNRRENEVIPGRIIGVQKREPKSSAEPPCAPRAHGHSLVAARGDESRTNHPATSTDREFQPACNVSTAGGRRGLISLFGRDQYI